MSPSARTPLLFAAVLALVVVGSIFYRQSLQERNPGANPTLPPEATTPAVTRLTDEDLHADLRDAMKAIETGDLETAHGKLSEVPVDHVSYPVALATLDGLLASQGRHDERIAVVTELVAVQSEDPRSYLALAAAEYDLGRFDAAEISALRALEFAPGESIVLYRLALCRLAQGRLTPAINTYVRAAERDPQNSGFLVALQDVERLAAARPEFADPHYVLGFFAGRLGQASREVEELTRFLDLGGVGPAADIARSKIDGRAAARNG